jgi:uncharacterized protein YjiS (DUF1127 family)
MLQCSIGEFEMNAITAMGRPAAGVSLRERLALWRERRAARLQIERDLNDHTDRQLAELGLSRSDIHAVAGGSYRAA